MNRLRNMWNHWRYYGLGQVEYNICMSLTFPSNILRLTWANMVFAILAGLFAVFPILTEKDYFKSAFYLTSAVIAVVLCVISKYKNTQFKQSRQISNKLIYFLIIIYFLNVIVFGLYLAVWANPGKIAGSFIGIIICVLFLLNISSILNFGLILGTVIVYIFCVIKFKVPSVWNYDIQNAIFAGSLALIFGWQIIMSRLTMVSSANKLEIERNKYFDQSRFKTAFLANMSHEIRTPMNAITGMAEVLLRGDMSDEMRCYAQDIKQAGNNLISIINDILDISKIEAGKLEIVNVNYTLSSMINDTVNIIRTRLTNKLIWFETNIDKNIPNNLIGDEVRLRQIILNLLSNAVKYTDKGGINFSIAVDKIKNADSLPADTVSAGGIPSYGKVWLRIAVTDTGRGIKPEDKEKLFNNFVQVDKERNIGIEGTGLGLAITKQLVEAMGGSISLESEYGRGTTFTVIIPQVIHSPEPIEEMEFVPGQNADNLFTVKYSYPNSRILIVDDLPVNLKVVEGLLSPYKAVIDVCLSGEEAVELVKHKKFDIIFMDHMMPGMDGIEATKIIRERGYTQPIIALTANAISGMKEKFLENGFSDFLAKPIDVIKLDEILFKWIQDDKRAEINDNTPNGSTPSADRGFLASISGVDTVKGISMTGGTIEKYKQVLAVFCENIQDRLPLLETMPNEETLRIFVIQVHSLKSSTATIGALELSAAAEALEEAGNAGDLALIKEKLPIFVDQLKELVYNISSNIDK